MAKTREKIEAIRLRRAGKSVGDIARTLRISKGTASAWCQGIELTDAQKERLRQSRIAGGHAGRMRGTEVNRQKKIDVVTRECNFAKEELGIVSKRDLLLISIALYWAEGSKTDSRFTFVNSDPAMIGAMCRFLQRAMGIEKKRLSITIQINEAHQKRIRKVMTFWSEYLEIPLNQFNNPYYIRTTLKKNYENHNNHFGVARLRVLRSSSLKYRMLGFISALKEQIGEFESKMC
jgi:hypothetical protein